MCCPDFCRRTLHPTPPIQEVITFFFCFFFYSPWCACVAWPFVITSECLHNLGLQKLLLLSHCLCNSTPRSQTAASRHPRPSRLLLPSEQPCQDRPFFTLALCLRCCLLLWPSPSVAADLIGNLSKVWRHFSTSGRFARQSSQVHLDVCDIA